MAEKAGRDLVLNFNKPSKDLANLGDSCGWRPEEILIITTPRGIRTPNLLLRRQSLYPVELWAQSF